jgi:ankyrin repeat domain-containing protein 50
MRLLKINCDGSFSLTTFIGSKIPLYAILSHTWEADNQELTFQDVMNGTGRSKSGYRKIQFCGDQAKKDGLQYFWVDSCCIDKSSSAELSEAINSMFRWYQNAAKCYVYLSDVSTGQHSRPPELRWESAFSRSRWFTRGWTLQELLASSSVEFFSREGMRLGDKQSLEYQIQQTTGIAVQALRGDSLLQFSVEERMSWAKDRETTKEEDQAYCLMGIFNVFLAVIYGEGEKNAHKRLREEIDKQSEKFKCLQALRNSEYEEFKDRNPDRLQGTCQWFLQHDYYREWRQSSSSRLLWVSADPGCGKSVLAKSLIAQEMKAAESRVTCYFFFKDDNEKQKSASTALSALLHQLFSQKDSLIQHAMQDHKAEGLQLSQSFHKLWSILMKAASDPKAGEVVCILDAIDECAESGRYQIIDALSTFYKQPTLKASGSQLKFVVTSRPYFDVERRFADLTRNFPTIRLHGEKESEAISLEINVVIRSEVSRLGRELELNDSERSTLEDELLNMTHRTYLWLKLIVEVIRDEISFTKRRLKRIVGTLPATVYEAYEAILSRVRDRDKKKVQKLLHIIVAATRPLTLKEINIALAIEDHHKCYDNLDLENEMRFGSSVRNLCGLFVSVVDQKIYLIHQTAKEFLIAKGETLTGRWRHSLDPGESDLTMARTCITYLMFAVFNEATNHTSATDEHGYLDYAARSWAAHYRRGQKSASKEILQSVLEVCDTRCQRFRTWFDIYWNMTHPSKRKRHIASVMLAGSYFGHETVVKLLLATGKADIDVQDTEYGQTPLSLAAENGHEAVVQLLLATGKADVDSKDNRVDTPLSLAARKGHEAVVQLLLATGEADVDSKNKWGQTPLSLAAEKGHEAVVLLLLEIGKADVDSKDDHCRTPLWHATWYQHEAVVKLLLEIGKADVNIKDAFGQTALSVAKETIAKLLLTTGKADVDSKDGEGKTPLWWAAWRGNEAVVKLLLATGKADVNSKDRKGRTPLWAGTNREAIIKLLQSSSSS